MKRLSSHTTRQGPVRVMGLDVGEKTIGVALSDELGMTAQPYQTIKRRGETQDLRAIRSILEERGVSAVIVGLPKNMDGTLGVQAHRVVAFARKIQSELNVPVVHWDERLSTVAAERVLIQADMSRAKRKKHVDKLAAALILQGYLDSGSASAAPSQPAGASEPGEG